MVRRLAALAAFTLGISLLSPAGAAYRQLPGTRNDSPAVAARPEQKLSRDWLRVRTPNFEAVGNAPADDIRRMLEQLEVFRTNLVTRILGLRTASSLPTLVVVFKDYEAFSRFQPRNERGRRQIYVGGYFTEQPDTNLIVQPRWTQRADSLRTIYHEYFHYILRRNAPRIPAWLAEGLSDFYSTSAFDPETGKTVVGAVIPSYVELLRGYSLVPFDELLSRDGSAKLERSSDPLRVGMFYSESWALVHLMALRDVGTGEAQIRAYADAAARDVPLEQAFHQAFGVTYEEAARLVTAYARRKSFPAMTITQGGAGAAPKSVVSPLTEAEAEFIQGDLLFRLGAADDAERSLRRALTLDASASATKVALAMLRITPGHAQEAIDALRPIADAEPENLRAHLALAAAYDLAERREEALNEYVKATGANEQSTIGWFGAARSALALGRSEESDRAIARLLAIDSRPDWIRARAYEAFQLGDFAVAARDARAYIDKAGPAAESAPYTAFLGAVSEWHLGHQAEAAAFLADVRPELTAGSWPSKILDFMQGTTAARPFLDSAKDAGQRTEAHAYLAFKLLTAGHLEDALAQLRWVREHGLRTYSEYEMALAELKRLEKSPGPQR